MVEMTSDASAKPSYAMTIANESYDWYRTRAIDARRAHRVSESMLLIVSAAVPTAAVLLPHDARLPAIFGAIAVVLAGLRSLFHWQDNYIRFSLAREAVESERRLYHTSAYPYDDPATRDRLLAAAVTRIEHDEMSTWIVIAKERPKGVS